MGKIAFVFPGQGAQYVGMGKEIYDSYDIAKEIMDKSTDVLGFDLKEKVFAGTEEELKQTEITQPAIVMVSTAISELLKSKGISPDSVAGLSLGEYSALVASGALDYDKALNLVRKRGKFMEEAVPLGKGAMAAIIGQEKSTIEDIVSELKPQGVIEIANYNCPGQIVISGEKELVEKGAEMAKERGAKRAVLLQVSGPFHTSLLEPAGEKLGEELKGVEIKEPVSDIYFNVTGQKCSSPDEIKQLLVSQVSNSVLWENIVENMLSEGTDLFIEIGMGKTLSSFIKKIAKDNKKEVKIYNIENIDTLEKFLSEYQA